MDCHKIIKKLQYKTIWQMAETELVDYCYAKGIRGDMLEFVVMIVVHEMKYEEIGKKLGYSVDTLKDWSPICKSKLGITSWKQHKN
jgi:thiaminase